MKKYILLSIMIASSALFQKALAGTNNEIAKPETVKDQTVVQEKNNNQYSFTLFDFFTKTSTNQKNDSTEILKPIKKENSVNKVNEVL